MSKKRLCLLLALLMMVSSFVACGGQPSTTQPDTSSTPPSDEEVPADDEEPTEITWFRNQINRTSIVYWNDAEWVKELERRTNMKIDFNGPIAAGNDYVQAVNVMLASEDYPDLIYFNWNNYKGGLAGAIADQVVVNYGENEDYRKLVPTWIGAIEDNEEIYRSVTLDDGTLALFCHVERELKRAAYEGVAIREDWLNQVGKSAPKTIDELYDVLVAFKDLGPDIIPMTEWKDIWTLRSLMAAWGLRWKTPYPDPDTGKITYLTEYKNGEALTDFVTTMKKWYDEGLLDADFSSQDGSAKDTKMTTGQAGMCFAWPGNYIGWRDAIVAADPSQETTAHFYGLQPLVGPAGKPYSANDAHIRWAASSEGTCITTAAEKAGKAEAILRMIDYMYTDEGTDLQNWGVEGVSHTINAEGKKEWTELITDHPDYSFGDAVLLYALPTQGAWPKWMDYEVWYSQECQTDDQKRMHENYWNADTGLLVPNIIVNEADAEEYRRIKADVDTLIDEYVISIIIGVKPLSDISVLLDQVDKMGIDNAMEIFQVSYDRYYEK